MENFIKKLKEIIDNPKTNAVSKAAAQGIIVDIQKLPENIQKQLK